MPIDKEKADRNIKDILDKMLNNTDAALFQEYYKLYKKEVPLFKRSWAAAWLFMYYDSKETPRPDSSFSTSKHKNKKIFSKNKLEDDVSENSADNSAEKSSIITLPEEESKNLFISIGKNRRLFPREIITLLISKTSTKREDIGIIRILDNYSFVQVRDTKADEIIENLTGFKFRGRTLTINYAKPKSNEEEN